MNRNDGNGPPDANDVGDNARGVGTSTDLEGDVDAVAGRPLARNLDGVGVGTDRRQAELLQQIHAVRVDLGDLDGGALRLRHEADEAADRSTAEDEHAIAGPDARPPHVVHRDRQRLNQRRIIVGQCVGHVEEPVDGHRPVVLHPAGRVDAENGEVPTEVRRTHPAVATGAAESDRLDDDAGAGCDRAVGRSRHDLRQHLVADRSVDRHAMIEMALEDVEVAAADAHAADAQERLAWSRRRHGLRDRLERPVAAIDRRANGRHHECPPLPSSVVDRAETASSARAENTSAAPALTATATPSASTISSRVAPARSAASESETMQPSPWRVTATASAMSSRVLPSSTPGPPSAPDSCRYPAIVARLARPTSAKPLRI